MADKATYLPLENLQPNPLQPRGVITPDSLYDLVESIKIHGIIEPIIVAHTAAGYMIIAGERRWRAAKLLKLTEVPVLIKETNPKGMLEMAIVENVQRTDLNPIDRAKSFKRLMEEFNLTVDQVGERIGKSKSYVSNTTRLLGLPDAIKDGLLSGVITEGHARALIGITDRATMVEAYKIVLKENGSVRRAEELARRLKYRTAEPEKINRALEDSEENRVRMIGERADETAAKLSKLLGKNCIVSISRSSGETSIKVVFKGDIRMTERQTLSVIRALKVSKNIR